MGKDAFNADRRRCARCRSPSRNPHRSADVIVHLAGQVAVTTSVIDPRDDFEIQCAGDVQRAGSRAAFGAESHLYLCLHQQGLWRHGGCGDRRGSHPLALQGSGQWRVPKRSRWISIRRTAARKGSRRSIRARLCPHLRSAVQWSSVRAASMARASLASKTRAGWPGSSSPQ